LDLKSPAYALKVDGVETLPNEAPSLCAISVFMVGYSLVLAPFGDYSSRLLTEDSPEESSESSKLSSLVNPCDLDRFEV